MVAQRLGVRKQLLPYYFWNPMLGLQSSGIDDRPARAAVFNTVDFPGRCEYGTSAGATGS
jgi:hypothetical protein